MDTVFLGGTTAGHDWRKDLISKLRGRSTKFVNPLTENWCPNDATIENINKDIKCTVHLYFITSDSVGPYSIAEAVQSSNNSNVLTYVHFDLTGLSDHQVKSTLAVRDLLTNNGAYVTIGSDSISTMADVLQILA